jgi:hypothetical protein
VVAFRDLVANRVPEQFPKLRFGFIEAAASWVPYIWHVLKRSARPDFKLKNPRDFFHEYRFWIACEADEELPHLINYLGEEHMVIGSDYGHNDPSKEPQFVQACAGERISGRKPSKKSFARTHACCTD